MPYINLERVRDVASAIKSIELKSPNLFDPQYYPESNEPVESVVMYFLTMVALDHRLSRPGRLYEAVVNGRKMRGADLLYFLGMKMYRSNPEFFRPHTLCRISASDIIAWLSIDGASPPDPDTRAMLLKDLGEKLIKLFNGNPLAILEMSGGYLRGKGSGLLDILRVFIAYSDPVEKKSMLLVKFLTYRGLFKFRDAENLRVPVDNHLTRIAIRLGIVDLEDHIKEKVLNGEPVGYSDDILIRYTVRETYNLVSIFSGVDPLRLDDFLWSLGREICVRDDPRCSLCPLKGACLAYSRGVFPNEHHYYDTWYY